MKTMYVVSLEGDKYDSQDVYMCEDCLRDFARRNGMSLMGILASMATPVDDTIRCEFCNTKN